MSDLAGVSAYGYAVLPLAEGQVLANRDFGNRLKNADLKITKVDTPGPGELHAAADSNRLKYTITVTNDGPGVAENVSVADVVDPNVTFDDNARRLTRPTTAWSLT